MKYAFHFYRKLHGFSGRVLYTNMLAMIVISLLEGMAILLLIPMLSISGIMSMDSTGIPFAHWLERFQVISPSIGLPIILGIYVLLALGQAFFQKNISIRNTIIQHGFSRQLRLETYGGILQANWDFFIKRRKSDLIHLITAEIARVSAGTNSFLQFIAFLIFTAAQLILAFWLSPVIAAFVLASGAALILLSRSFLARSQKLGSITVELGQSYLAGITDQINGIKDIKSNRLEGSRMDWYRDLTERMKNEQVEYTKLRTSSSLYYKLASAVLIALFIYISVTLFRAQHEQLLLIVVIFSRLWPRFSGIQASMEQIAALLPTFKSLYELHEQCSRSREFEAGSLRNAEVQPLCIKRGIMLENIWFRYDKELPSYALKDVSLHIPTNSMTAIVGHSGAGKSTLVDVVMGLLQPESGRVMVDDQLLAGDTVLSLRESLGYVPQDSFLFNASIRENLLIVKPDAREDEMLEVLQFSSADEFVRKLPEGLDTVIGDRGVRLSGGERQRLVLARAMLRKPSILILDEATSALDNENEAKIRDALERIKGTMTIIVIAHRLSTIQDADQVIVMEDGRIAEIGQYKELVNAKRGVFGSFERDSLRVQPR